MSLARSVKRLRPERVRGLTPRPPGALPRLSPELVRQRLSLLLDTTVYVDVLRGRSDELLDAALGACRLWHSPVCLGELARGLGADDPRRPGYRRDVRLTTRMVEAIPEHRVLLPDVDVHELAGIASGILARVLGLGREARARHGADALVYFTARRHGLPVLTRNRRDFDLLQQLDPTGRVVVY